MAQIQAGRKLSTQSLWVSGNVFIANFDQYLNRYLNKHLAKEKLDAESQHTFMADDNEGPFPHMGVGDVIISISVSIHYYYSSSTNYF